MNLLVNRLGRLSLLYQTLYFLKKHLLVILSLGLIAAFGRVIQLGGFGPITPQANIFLEVVIELVRLLIFLYVLGVASFKKGALRIMQLFTNKTSRKLYWSVALQKIRRHWMEVLVSFFVFLGIAWIINYLIDLLAYQTCFYLALQQNEILNPNASEWTIILFFKNISVIPLTLTFEAGFCFGSSISFGAKIWQQHCNLHHYRQQKNYCRWTPHCSSHQYIAGVL